MTGAKIEYVKKSLKLMLNFLENSRLALILFSDQAEMVMNFKTVNSDNRPKIEEIIDSLFILKDTNITQSVKLAQSMIGKRLHRNPAASVFVLSDGIHNKGPIDNRSLFSNEEAATKGQSYTVHTFGYGDDHDAQQLQSIAEHKFGNYYFVDDIEKVDEYFIDCIGSITSTVALEGKINLRFKPNNIFKDIKVTKAYGPYFQSKSATEWSIDLPSMYAGMKKDFVLMLHINYKRPANLAEIPVEVADLSLSFKRIGTSTHLSTSKKLVVSFSGTDSFPPPRINLEVRKNYLRVRAAEVITWVMVNKSNTSFDGLINELGNFKQKELEAELELQNDPLVVSIGAQISQVIQMLINERTGVKNKVKVANFVVEAAHVMYQQQSNPQSAVGQLNRNCYQMMNVAKLASLKRGPY